MTKLTQLRRFSFVSVIFALALASTLSFAQGRQAQDTPPPVQDGATVIATLVDAPPEKVVRDILRNDPTAVVYMRENVAHDLFGGDGTVAFDINADAEAPAALPAPQALAQTPTIRPQWANSFNTLMLSIQYSYMLHAYIVDPSYNWHQSAALVAYNLAYLGLMDLRPGRWTKFMQWGGRFIRRNLQKIRVIPQDRWESAETFTPQNIYGQATNPVADRVEGVGNVVTHVALNAAYYALLEVMRNIDHVGTAFSSGVAEFDILRSSGIAVLSSIGWVLMARRWDPRSEDERPISRQAFTAFNNVRGLYLGLWIPGLISMSTSTSFTDILSRTSPFLISAAAGIILYAGKDAIFERLPFLRQTFGAFQKVTDAISGGLKKCIDIIRPRAAASGSSP